MSSTTISTRKRPPYIEPENGDSISALNIDSSSDALRNTAVYSEVRFDFLDTALLCSSCDAPSESILRSLLPHIQRLAYNGPIYVFDVHNNALINRIDLVNQVTASLYDYMKRQVPYPFNVQDFATQQLDDLLLQISLLCRYAILSHRWEADELRFADAQDLNNMAKRRGYKKFYGFCDAAEEYGCRYVWLDTLCIDKTSTSELDESIRSMYLWYRSAYVCIVYLTVTDDSRFEEDPWFTRGWTLQELLAPQRVKFFRGDWTKFTEGSQFDIVRNVPDLVEEGDSFGDDAYPVRRGRRHAKGPSFPLTAHDKYAFPSEQDSPVPKLNLWDEPYDSDASRSSDCPSADDEDSTAPKAISLIETDSLHFIERVARAAGIINLAMPPSAHGATTGVSAYSLQNYQPNPNRAHTVFVWAARRTTSRPEDIAYCLFGLLDVATPIAYGEGKSRAFYRLQVECIRNAEDKRIFVWRGKCSAWNSMLPDDPSAFLSLPSSSNAPVDDDLVVDWTGVRSTFSFTNAGINIFVYSYKILTSDKPIIAQGPAMLGGRSYTIKFSLLAQYDTEVTILWKGKPPTRKRICSSLCVAILGQLVNHGGRPFALLLSTTQGNRYTRLGSAQFNRMPPYAEFLQDRNYLQTRQTIYIT